MKKIHGKPFDYFKLGKSFSEGRSFMEHMKTSALDLIREAQAAEALTEVSLCPICGGEEFKEFAKVHGFLHWQCETSDCRHVFVAPLITQEARARFFSQDTGYSQKNYCDPKLSEFRIKNIALPKIKFAKEHARSGANSWLDVGCGSGEILAALKAEGWKALGLELSEQDREFGREHFKVEILGQTLEEFAAAAKQRFDVISFYGVIHCVADPAALVKDAASLLNPGGIIVAEISHHESIESAAVQSFPDHPSRSCYNGTTTLHHFTQDSAARLFRKAGLEPQAVWFYGTDIFEILNQWCFSSPGFVGSPLYEEILKLSSDLQAVIDKREKSSGMTWVAKKGSER